LCSSRLIEVILYFLILVRVQNHPYIYPKESSGSTPYSESPVWALQELNGASEAEFEAELEPPGLIDAE
jgi:hypothetical protein